MPLKPLTTKPRDATRFRAYTYRAPLPVTKIRTFANGNTYPICPRCVNTLDREYMSFCDRCGQKLSWHYFTLARTTGSVKDKEN